MHLKNDATLNFISFHPNWLSSVSFCRLVLSFGIQRFFVILKVLQTVGSGDAPLGTPRWTPKGVPKRCSVLKQGFNGIGVQFLTKGGQLHIKVEHGAKRYTSRFSHFHLWCIFTFPGWPSNDPRLAEWTANIKGFDSWNLWRQFTTQHPLSAR